MGIKFNCTACGKRMNVKSFLAGKRGICPHCGAKVEIPAESQVGDSNIQKIPAAVPMAAARSALESQPVLHVPTSPASLGNGTSPAAVPAAAPVAAKPMAAVPTAAPASPMQAVPMQAVPMQAVPMQAVPVQALPIEGPPSADPIDEAPNAVWYVRPPSGGQYGPASGEIMRRWVTEGRVSSDSLVWREGWSDWKPAAETLPGLGGGARPPAVAPAPPAPSAAMQGPFSNSPIASASSPARSYPCKRGSNVTALVLVVVLTLASIGLLGILIAVIQFVR